MQQTTIKKGQVVELRIESAAFEGFGVARAGGLVVFVRNAVPGDRVRALIQRKKRRFAHAIVEEVLEPSPDRVSPRCLHFGVCGGCHWQNLDYPRQLEIKRQHVAELLGRIGHLGDQEVQPVIGAAQQYHYRNKMEFSFGASRWLTREEIESGESLRKDFALGLHVPRRFDKILDLQECHLPDEICRRILSWVRNYALDQGWSAYHWRTHRGYLRNLAIRFGQATGQVLVNLVTHRRQAERMEAFGRALAAAFPQVATFMNSVNETLSPVAAGEVFVEFGSGTIREELAGLKFRLGPSTFFQPNTRQAERLFEVVREFADLSGRESVLDLFCGVGAISLFLARHTASVVGVEVQEQAVEEARANAQRNGLDNCRFVAADALEAFQDEFRSECGNPDVIILDPPRSGLHPELNRTLAAQGAPRLIYVSCNPATQARDLEVLASHYQVEAVQPVDMFPQTYHIENVVALARK